MECMSGFGAKAAVLANLLAQQLKSAEPLKFFYCRTFLNINVLTCHMRKYNFILSVLLKQRPFH